jgi:hypothetical protein
MGMVLMMDIEAIIMAKGEEIPGKENKELGPHECDASSTSSSSHLQIQVGRLSRLSSSIPHFSPKSSFSSTLSSKNPTQLSLTIR